MVDLVLFVVHDVLLLGLIFVPDWHIILLFFGLFVDSIGLLSASAPDFNLIWD